MFELFICGSRGISSEVKTFGKLSAESAEKTFAKKSDGGTFSLHFYIFYVFFFYNMAMYLSSYHALNVQQSLGYQDICQSM